MTNAALTVDAFDIPMQIQSVYYVNPPFEALYIHAYTCYTLYIEAPHPGSVSQSLAGTLLLNRAIFTCMFFLVCRFVSNVRNGGGIELLAQNSLASILDHLEMKDFFIDSL